MKCWIVLPLLVLIFSGRAVQAADLELAAAGKTAYQLVVPNSTANAELGACLGQMARLIQCAFAANGVEIPIAIEGAHDAARPSIFVGNTQFAQQQGVETSQLKHWGYVHRVVGRDVIIAGRDHASPEPSLSQPQPRIPWARLGTAKGVADFLREYVGTRFLYPEIAPRQSISAVAKIDPLLSPAIEFLPRPVIKVPSALNVRKSPPIEFNSAYPEGGSYYDLANNRFPPVADVFGAHTYERAVPVAKYAQTHPEYFALLGGQRSGGNPGNAQYCISNPEVQELIYQDLLSWLDRGFEAVDLGQPDGFRACQCEACAKLYNTGSDWNEKLWIFHRTLAERVLQSRPGKQVIMMSYIQTELPPKSFDKLPDNTIVLLSGTNDEDFAAWKGFHVPGGYSSYIYNSTPNLATRYTPMRTPRYVATQVKRLVAHRVRSIYRDGNGMLFGLEGPTYYTMGRMFDDPENLQPKELVHEFCEAAFGKAMPPMIQFYDQLYHGIELYSEFLGTRSPAWSYQNIYGQGRKYLTDPFQMIGFLYTPSLLASLETNLAQAEKLADSDKRRQRLELIRREFDYVKWLAKVVHLYHAYQVQPDLSSRDRLLDAIDGRNAFIASLYDERNRTRVMGGWAYTLFPMIGHDAKHLQLAHNGYQEPYANTAVNWDTKSMRAAPLPGAKRLVAARVTEPPALDSPAWSQAVASPLAPATPSSQPSLNTQVRVLFDNARIYVRLEAELAADETLAAQPESLTVYLAPTANREIAYRFTVGPRADAKQGAATGFTADLLDPRYGKFDLDWKADWSYTMRLDRAPRQWLALVSVPYASLKVESPREGATWRANFARQHTAATASARALWSAAAGGKIVDDLGDFGELAFESAAPQATDEPKTSVLHKLREELYRSSFELPADWRKLPNPLPQPLGPWLFRKDPIEQGVKQQWFAVDAALTDWQPIRVPTFWAETESVGKHEGYGWYRTTFVVPANWQGRAIRIGFAAVDEQAWVYLNGKLIREHTESSQKQSINELWETPFVAHVPADQLRHGQPNVLVVRVHNSIANGGIWRPVVVHAVDAK